MPHLVVVTRDGAERMLDAPVNRTIMEIIRGGRIGELLALCGGCCSCATCHIYVEAKFSEKLPPLSVDEDALLDGSHHRGDMSRLSCQIRMTEILDGMRVILAPEE